MLDTGEGRDLSGYSSNLVGIPAWQIAALEFNQAPQRLRIAGTQETHAGLFHLLQQAQHAQDAAQKFRRYLDMVFQLAPSAYELTHATTRRFRPSYYKLLQGWGFDANSPQGAVLKGWVQSRFGIMPSFHKESLHAYASPAWMAYVEEKFASRFYNSSIYTQLDLLYEFCQFVLQRFQPFAGEHVTLWRGVNSYDQTSLTESPLRKGQCVLRLNNLVSLSTSRERADEFGDWILEVQVPLVKLLLFPDLMDKPLLAGENEVLALGGWYQVQAHYV